MKKTAVALTACEAADRLNAKLIICLTLSGSIVVLFRVGD